MLDALRRHWPEYLMEAALLGGFMVSACGFGVLLFHGESSLARLWPAALGRRVLMGLAMGGTAIALLYSPWGKQSGGHINPAVTLTFYRLGKMKGTDAVWYVVSQFVGAALGVAVALLVFGRRLAEPGVHYVVTMPGPRGAGVAFIAELVISGFLMATILAMSNHPRLANYTGVVAGGLVALYISIEAPLSGMSMNPARTFGSAVWAGSWTGWWVYFTAPLFGMLVAAEWRRLRGAPMRACAKLHHDNDWRCIFCGKAAGARVTRPVNAEPTLRSG